MWIEVLKNAALIAVATAAGVGFLLFVVWLSCRDSPRSRMAGYVLYAALAVTVFLALGWATAKIGRKKALSAASQPAAQAANGGNQW